MAMQPVPPESVGKEVLYELVDNAIALIRLNRPQRRNAINAQITEALSYIVRHTEEETAVRAVILTSSSPDFFCAGADLSTIAAGRIAELATSDGGLGGLVTASRKKPWIAAVAGPSLAGGFELCLACDMIVATADARFGLPEVKRGLLAVSGGVHRTVRVLPRNLALELITTGEPIGADRAFQIGLVNRLSAAHSLLDDAIALARSIATNAPLAVRESLAIARIAAEITDEEAHRVSAAASERVFASEDAKEGTRAFLEKRQPKWQGR